MSFTKSIFIAAALAAPLTLTAAPYAMAAPSAEDIQVIKDTADVTVGLNGLVCDFCSIALNKTFKKHKAVKATYVDLDNKSLSVVFKEGTSLNDTEITKLVEKAGYNVSAITRKAG